MRGNKHITNPFIVTMTREEYSEMVSILINRIDKVLNDIDKYDTGYVLSVISCLSDLTTLLIECKEWEINVNHYNNLIDEMVERLMKLQK